MRIILIVLLVPILSGCLKSDYTRMVEKEMERRVRVDSMFLGLRLGMTSKEFYKHCWDMNRKGLFREGLGNNSVQYIFYDLKDEARMLFYPKFYNDTIYEMPVMVSYVGWAPWNLHLQADSLQVEMIHLYERWYGKGFIKVEIPEEGICYVKVDGNRRIIIHKKDDSNVRILYTDLIADERIRKKNGKK